MLILAIVSFASAWTSSFGDILGTPQIECREDGIKATVQMSTPFSGRVYLKGHSATEGCFQDYSQNATSLLLPVFNFERCSPRRKREVIPAGVRMQTRMIISHHPRVETFRDVAYDIDCFYRQMDEVATAAQELRVISDAPPQEMRMVPAPPKCSYRVEIGNTTSSPGEVISTVFVGDVVTHVWSCDEGASYEMYCIRVHDCTARGEDQTIAVVDSSGCITESELLSPLSHSSTSTRVSATSRIFKFPNSTGIYFDCQISFSLRAHEEGQACPTSQCLTQSRRSKRSWSTSSQVDSQELVVLEDRLAFYPPLKVCPWLNGPVLVISSIFLVYVTLSICACLTPSRRV